MYLEDINGHIVNLDTLPRPLALFDSNTIGKIYNDLNFDYSSQIDPVVEVSDVFLPRTVCFDRISQENRASWFFAPTDGKPYILRQTWKKCNQADARVLRDLYCAYYLTLHGILEKVKSIKFTKSGGDALQGWSDVWVDPADFVTDFCSNLQCSESDVDRLWNDYGIDLFRFIETQYTLRSAIYSFKPNAIEVKPGPRNEGRNMYLLTCLMQSNGKFKLRQYPPQLFATPTIALTRNKRDCVILPDIWHPHLSVSKSPVSPDYSVTGDTSWLKWKPDANWFEGEIPNLDELTSVSGEDQICITITGDYILTLGSSSIELCESITSRVYIRIYKEAKATEEETLVGYYPPNPLDFLWGSKRLGFDKKHSDVIVKKSRQLENKLMHGFNDVDARRYAAFNEGFHFKVGPPIISLGPISWYDYLDNKRTYSEYPNCKYNETGRGKLVRQLREGSRSHFSEEKPDDEIELDSDLEDMRQGYENQFNEASALIWLRTIYHEDIQDRLEQEAIDDAK
ncbi:hypothetical protein ABW19_dt0210293 [Dactylella cylindrospora]|nr:hypothetical protein ABW19_dt0210293 [Dactylella cylindrospora]